jgi:hypothetical protein
VSLRDIAERFKLEVKSVERLIVEHQRSRASRQGTRNELGARFNGAGHRAAWFAAHHEYLDSKPGAIPRGTAKSRREEGRCYAVSKL